MVKNWPALFCSVHVVATVPQISHTRSSETSLSIERGFNVKASTERPNGRKTSWRQTRQGPDLTVAPYSFCDHGRSEP